MSSWSRACPSVSATSSARMARSSAFVHPAPARQRSASDQATVK
jgi:hypothetical protein